MYTGTRLTDEECEEYEKLYAENERKYRNSPRVLLPALIRLADEIRGIRRQIKGLREDLQEEKNYDSDEASGRAAIDKLKEMGIIAGDDGLLRVRIDEKDLAQIKIDRIKKLHEIEARMERGWYRGLIDGTISRNEVWAERMMLVEKYMKHGDEPAFNVEQVLEVLSNVRRARGK
jgi:hypothetical protein